MRREDRFVSLRIAAGLVIGGLTGSLLYVVAIPMVLATWTLSLAYASDEFMRAQERKGKPTIRAAALRNASISMMSLSIGWLAFDLDFFLGLLAVSLGTLPAFVFWASALRNRPTVLAAGFIVVFTGVVTSFVLYLAMRTSLPILFAVGLGVVIEVVVVYDVVKLIIAERRDSHPGLRS